MTSKEIVSPDRHPVAFWEVSGDVLRLTLPDGSHITPTADEIYRVAVEGLASDTLPSPIVPAGVPDIHFSRYPLLLEIRIEARGAGGAGGLRATIYATGEDSAIPIPDVFSRVADHVITRGAWHR